ncbi:MAG TPA: nuclear transport factor 2 family protein [Steroidobacteraceae bacterium]|nr:nuclear transport factor 2 family protein [Steroidobacteraceae bacterium]
MDRESDTECRAELERLAARVCYLEDLRAIEKLQAKYAHYLFTQRYGRIVDECFARQSEDVTLEFSDSGVYRGREKLRAVYRDFEAARVRIPGFFILHMAVNPYIEVARDGRSAHSHWLSPGAVGSSSSAGWVWGPYYIDYVKEGDEWRILHTNLAPLFRNRYEVSWAEAKDHGTVRRWLTVQPDAGSTIYRPYSEVKGEPDLFRNHPDLPEPF